jgi:hypothetical protein
LENSDYIEAEKMSRISDCFHGFHNDKNSQTWLQSSQKKEVIKMSVKGRKSFSKTERKQKVSHALR